MMKLKLAAAATLIAVCAAPAVYAHHSFAAYDQSKTIVLKEATVTKFEWTNPHSWIHVTAKNDKGETESWDVECGAPNLMVRQGWKQKDIKSGDVVTIAFAPLRDGNRGGSMKYIVLPDGSQRGQMGPAPGAAGGADAGGYPAGGQGAPAP